MSFYFHFTLQSILILIWILLVEYFAISPCVQIYINAQNHFKYPIILFSYINATELLVPIIMLKNPYPHSLNYCLKIVNFIIKSTIPVLIRGILSKILKLLLPMTWQEEFNGEKQEGNIYGEYMVCGRTLQLLSTLHF